MGESPSTSSSTTSPRSPTPKEAVDSLLDGGSAPLFLLFGGDSSVSTSDSSSSLSVPALSTGGDRLFLAEIKACRFDCCLGWRRTALLLRPFPSPFSAASSSSLTSCVSLSPLSSSSLICSSSSSPPSPPRPRLPPSLPSDISDSSMSSISSSCRPFPARFRVGENTAFALAFLLSTLMNATTLLFVLVSAGSWPTSSSDIALPSATFSLFARGATASSISNSELTIECSMQSRTKSGSISFMLVVDRLYNALNLWIRLFREARASSRTSLFPFFEEEVWA
mmetsp:Transcript_35673/g.92979  ORF Transcript_35673/g.92979 Transcript_35673/m.92979 type:complete len:281 (-) Transcript_35673:78-920(-)